MAMSTLLLAIGSFQGLGPMLFMVMNTDQIIKTIVLIGEANNLNEYSVHFL